METGLRYSEGFFTHGPREQSKAARVAAALLFGALILGGCSATYQPMGPIVREPALISGADAEPLAANVAAAIVTADGYRLPLRRWLPEGEPATVIVALHGYNDYSNAFADAAPVWAEAGIATYAYDQRGFGRTTDPGIWPGAETPDRRP